MKTGSCSSEREAGAQGIDLVLLVELHHLLVLALLVVLVLRLQRLDLRRERLQALHRLELLERQREQRRADHDRQRDDRDAPRQADVSWKNVEDRLEDIDQRLEDVREDGHGSADASRARRRAEQALRLDGIEAAVAPRVAAQQPPRRRGRARAVCRTAGSPARRRPSSVGSYLQRARKQRRDDALVDAAIGATATPARAAHDAAPPAATAVAPDELSERAANALEPVALGELARLGPRHDHEVVAAGSSSRQRPNASRSRRLTRLRSTAPPTLRETDSAEPRRSASSPRAGTRSRTKWRLPSERPWR